MVVWLLCIILIDCVVYELLSQYIVQYGQDYEQLYTDKCHYMYFAMFLAKVAFKALRRPDCGDDLRVMYSRTVEDGCTVHVMVRALIITAE